MLSVETLILNIVILKGIILIKQNEQVFLFNAVPLQPSKI